VSDDVVVITDDSESDSLTATQYSEIMAAIGSLAERIGALEVATVSNLEDAADDVRDLIDDAVEATVEAEIAADVAEAAAEVAVTAAVVADDAAEEAEVAAEEIVEVAETPVNTGMDIPPLIEDAPVMEVSETEDEIAPVPTHFMHRPVFRRRR
jgi:hypothetical protein